MQDGRRECARELLGQPYGIKADFFSVIEFGG